ncbi:cysteine--tRNA ligase [Candidatus Saccharibacteria bacterium]|nr:cysteine--tRNA ligase [Candidatus Saccharibacteria bacterium]
MNLKFYNQLTRRRDMFSPIEEGKVTLYTCGPTVYSDLTVGNWAAYIYWDTLVRVLRAHDLNVTRVLNITDVGHLVSDEDEGEDKLEKGATREGKTAWEVARLYTERFMDGMTSLNLVRPEHMPRATEYIDQQLELVRTLKEKGHTYQIGDGIYFDSETFPQYADFAELDLEKQKAGARIEINPEKRNASDFALWKFTPEGQNRDMQWETPADLTSDGDTPMGFPGWHLECSAMVLELLGTTIDIHTGGIDHIPVHHTNEIAQSQSANGVKLSNFWLHNNHLKVDGTKISKSLGNGYTLDDIIKHGFGPLDFRLFVLQGHYKSEGNFTFENVEAAAHRRRHWRNIAALRHQTHDTLVEDTVVETESKTVALYASSQAILEALSDDLNSPLALSIIDESFSLVEKSRANDIHQHALTSFLETIDELLGLDLLKTTPDITDEQKQFIVARNRARERQDFKEADSMREKLEKQGVALRDTPSGVIWEYA